MEQFLVENPTSQRAWIDMGQALAQLSRYEKAESAFKKVIELAGEADSGAIFGEIGNLYRAKADFETAKTWYQKQIDADPDDATGLLYLGNLLMRQGELEESKAAFESALKCKLVCFEETHFALGLVHRCLGEFAEAKTQFQRAIDYDDKFLAAKAALKDVSTMLNMQH